MMQSLYVSVTEGRTQLIHRGGIRQERRGNPSDLILEMKTSMLAAVHAIKALEIKS